MGVRLGQECAEIHGEFGACAGSGAGGSQGSIGAGQRKRVDAASGDLGVGGWWGRDPSRAVENLQPFPSIAYAQEQLLFAEYTA